ncbi:transmembrane 9 superfamily member 4-like [Halichondria panicea]|uniref:transmembrane 9 superfamily member 4-like n=1 Tax=Halichondria panicea TaxID=6063 RepID=UPI00312B9A7D
MGDNVFGMKSLIICSLFTLQICLSNGFYIPGVAPAEFHGGEELIVKAVKMTSVKTQLPYEYYSLPFCRPADEKMHYKKLNLGEVLRGDRIVNTPYMLRIRESVDCKVLCTVDLTSEQTDMFIEKIDEDYTVHMIADNLPAASVFKNLKTNELQYEDGYKLGFISNDKYILNNHLTIVIKYHDLKGADAEPVYRVVGFEVETKSYSMDSMMSVTPNNDQGVPMADVKSEDRKHCKLNSEQTSVLQLQKGTKTSVMFTYTVVWQASDVAWASRWDIYLQMSDVQIHWFAICNSVAIVLFLSGILALIIIRTLRRDIAKYNQDEEMDDSIEETGWKLVHGDVFRPPRYPTLLVACLGSGIQIFCMVFIVIVFAMFGMLSPASRGSLMTAAIVLFMFMGVTGGYHAARLFRTFKGNSWKKAASITAVFFPSVVFCIGFFLNCFIWGEHSSGAVPFTTMLALLCMWFGISFPLIFGGFYFGFRKQPYEHPVRTNQIPRQIPEQVWYMNPVVASLIAGILPFGAVFVELFFILTAIWENQFYYLFGFLFLVFVILIIACSEVAIVMTYFQLCGEDYHWWWRSFLLSGSASYYVVAYSVLYYYTKLDITEFVPTLLYFGYSLVMVFGFWLLTGTIGFYATYLFICRIYAAVKQD